MGTTSSFLRGICLVRKIASDDVNALEQLDHAVTEDPWSATQFDRIRKDRRGIRCMSPYVLWESVKTLWGTSVCDTTEQGRTRGFSAWRFDTTWRGADFRSFSLTSCVTWRSRESHIF